MIGFVTGLGLGLIVAWLVGLHEAGRRDPSEGDAGKD